MIDETLKEQKAAPGEVPASSALTAVETSAEIKKKKKVKKHVPRAHIHIQATFNNTIISVADPMGAVLFQVSAGKSGFKGPKKSTPYAASTAVRSVMEKFQDYGIEQVDVTVRGAGSGREAAIRALHACGLIVVSIKDRTPVPHNGPRPPKVRRV